jgi:membrane protease YdiL (CAAX protease family)
MNAVRALIVRAALPASRYRGPSILILLLLTFILTSIGSLAAINDAAALLAGDAPSVGGALLLLTVTQASLLAIAGIFVVAPRALEGVRLLPPRGGFRTFLLGLALAVPAWIGANLVSLIMTVILRWLGREPERGIVDSAISQVDPTVLILAIVVVAPVAEEVFFRGIVYGAWLREHGPRVALFGSAGLFAVIHANTLSVDALIASVVTIVPIFGLGLALALTYRLTGSLPAAIGLHAGFNGITICLALLVRLGVLDIPISP